MDKKLEEFDRNYEYDINDHMLIDGKECVCKPSNGSCSFQDHRCVLFGVHGQCSRRCLYTERTDRQWVCFPRLADVQQQKKKENKKQVKNKPTHQQSKPCTVKRPLCDLNSHSFLAILSYADQTVILEHPLPEDGELFPTGVNAWVWDNDHDSRTKTQVHAVLPSAVETEQRVVSQDGKTWTHMAIIPKNHPNIRHPTIADVDRGCLVRNMKWVPGRPKYVCLTETTKDGLDGLVFNIATAEFCLPLADLEFVCYLDEIPALALKERKTE